MNASDKLSAFDSNAAEKTTAFNDNYAEKLGDFNTNAASKLTDFNENAAEKLADFNDNAETKITAYDENAAEKLSAFNTNASTKTQDFNDNYSDKLSDFDANASDKTGDFNDNATAKTTAFNDNAAIKQAAVDASAAAAAISETNAANSATSASNSAGLAKQWAIGEPTEPAGNSAKYWADQASSELSGLTSRVSTIEGKIPSAASASNQLADKSYVNTADNGLQSQIDAIVASSDVFDIVGTYAELQAYDISTVPVNDIIKVLVDSTHDNAATYYRCVETGGVKSWSYIGTEAAYYTKAQSDARFATAAQGALADTAVQPDDLATVATTGDYDDLSGTPTLAAVATSGSYNDLSNKPTIPAAQVNSDWNATSGVAQILNKPALATVATSGAYSDLSGTPTIPTVNDATLTIQKNGASVATFTANSATNATANITVPTDTAELSNGAGFITSSALPTVNNSTITLTQGGVVKGSFTLNQATGATIALDSGGSVINTDGVTINTNADDELQAIGVIEKNAGNVKYDWVGTSAEYTAQNVATLHPDWVCYITDDEVSAVGDFVVSWKTPTASDKTWYRKYASGWVEQGGIIDLGGDVSSAGYELRIPLVVEMADTNYYKNIMPSGNTGGGQYMGYCCVNTVGCTTTILKAFFVKTEQSYRYFCWEVKGMAL